MIFLLDFCSLPWLLPWLLPFLLGLLLGWLLWARYRRILAQCEKDLEACRKHNSELEEDLAECRKSYHALDNENATLRGRIRELELNLRVKEEKLSDLESGITDTPTDVNVGIGSAGLVSNLGADSKADDAAVKIGSSSMYAALKEDNLQIIEGIGPKMESVMKDNGINSWGALAGKSANDLRSILSSEQYGRKYQIIDPETWPQQASLARDGKWEELIALQKALDTGRTTATSITDSKVEKLLIKLGVLRKFKKNDLKVVEGIGPKIEALMQDNGIDTWAKLASSSPERLQGILNSAGDRFKLADPGTWPRQAQLADEGKWDELQEYQDFLQGGRE